eukprot:TRINITY_DN82026_c0_g1_i1.p1 TRINITY_DN82026_c0_g1~~TRINITY_DN82026_c0_g1_i1.p1  ORF type:complete len:226 (+),score=61.18 TRINITY_DN82026_c0_g1_i1:108-785(+)
MAARFGLFGNSAQKAAMTMLPSRRCYSTLKTLPRPWQISWKKDSAGRAFVSYSDGQALPAELGVTAMRQLQGTALEMKSLMYLTQVLNEQTGRSSSSRAKVLQSHEGEAWVQLPEGARWSSTELVERVLDLDEGAKQRSVLKHLLQAADKLEEADLDDDDDAEDVSPSEAEEGSRAGQGAPEWARKPWRRGGQASVPPLITPYVEPFEIEHMHQATDEGPKHIFL